MGTCWNFEHEVAFGFSPPLMYDSATLLTISSGSPFFYIRVCVHKKKKIGVTYVIGKLD